MPRRLNNKYESLVFGRKVGTKAGTKTAQLLRAQKF
jgi:hypothetical protein